MQHAFYAYTNLMSILLEKKVNAEHSDTQNKKLNQLKIMNTHLLIAPYSIISHTHSHIYTCTVCVHVRKKRESEGKKRR